MEDTVYRQDAIDEIRKCRFVVDAIDKIKDLPSAQPENIRCKDCKHWDGYYCHNKYWGDGNGYYTPPIKTEDGFCDWAERKEE